MPSGHVYILASQRNGTFYVGVTSDLTRRVWEHRTDRIEGFTERYGVHRLVYAEPHDDIRDDIRREKQIKKWERAWKLRLIEAEDPGWDDLYPLLEAAPPARQGRALYGGDEEAAA